MIEDAAGLVTVEYADLPELIVALEVALVAHRAGGVA